MVEYGSSKCQCPISYNLHRKHHHVATAWLLMKFLVPLKQIYSIVHFQAFPLQIFVACSMYSILHTASVQKLHRKVMQFCLLCISWGANKTSVHSECSQQSTTENGLWRRPFIFLSTIMANYLCMIELSLYVEERRRNSIALPWQQGATNNNDNQDIKLHMVDWYLNHLNNTDWDAQL